MKLIFPIRPLAAAFLAAILSAGTTLATDIVGHRGAPHEAPENTIASARLAGEQKADAVEIDIYLSKDGRIVGSHDADTKRTTGVPGKVADKTWDELRKLDAGTWKSAQCSGERLPSLEEIIATIPDGKRLFIEIKCGPGGLPELERVLKATGLKAEQTVIIGFNYDTMVQARKRFPQVAVQWLASFKKNKETGAVTPTVNELILKARAGGLTGISVNHRGPVDAGFVRSVKAAGLECHVWTVNDPAAARHLQAAGVNSISTDRPGFLREQLQ